MQITTLPKDDVKRGEIYYISRGGYNTGSEQQADRPGVIVSNDKNNKNSQTLEVVYLTTQPKNELPTHCTIRSTGRVSTVCVNRSTQSLWNALENTSGCVQRRRCRTST